MPTLNWNEIRTRAAAFAKDWANEDSERAEAQSFWNEFFEVFGVKRRRVAVFEKQVAKLPDGGKTTHGRIDVFWPGTLLAEHKSAGRDLDAAVGQALDYFSGLKTNEFPRYIVVSDFARLRLIDLANDQEWEFPLRVPANIERFGFNAGYEKQRIRDEDPISERADCDNRIKELKYDFAADSFNMRDFWAKEATLTALAAYNLRSLLRQVLLKTSAVKRIYTTKQTACKAFEVSNWISTCARQ